MAFCGRYFPPFIYFLWKGLVTGPIYVFRNLLFFAIEYTAACLSWARQTLQTWSGSQGTKGKLKKKG